MEQNSFLKRIKAFKRPLWLQWNLFPKDGQPPTHSALEILVYLAFYAGCIYLFVKVNEISYNVITIDADKLGDDPTIRYIKRGTDKDSTALYFHYQRANIKLNIQRTLVDERNKANTKTDSITKRNSVVVYNAIVKEDSMLINNIDSISEKTLRQLGLTTPFWRAVFYEAVKKRRKHHEGDSVLYKICDYYEKHDVDNYNWNPFVKIIHNSFTFPKDIIMSIPNGMTAGYRFNFSCGISNHSLYEEIDSTWIIEDTLRDTVVNISKNNKITPEPRLIRNFNASRSSIKDGNFNVETYTTTNRSKYDGNYCCPIKIGID